MDSRLRRERPKFDIRQGMHTYYLYIHKYIHTSSVHTNTNSTNISVNVFIGRHERVGEVEVGVHLREGFDTCVVFAHGQRQTGGYK